MEDFHTVMNAGMPIFLVGAIIVIILSVLWWLAGEISGSIDIRERLRSLVKIIVWGVFYIGAIIGGIVGGSYLLGLIAIKLGMN